MSLINSFRDRIVAMVADAFPQLVYGSTYEYRITPSSAAGRFDLVPVRTKLVGQLPRVYQWGGPGIEAAYAAGATVLVTFIDADETLPAVVGYMPARLPGGLPTDITIDATTLVKVGPSGSVELAIAPLSLGAGVARIGDFVVRLFQDTVTGIVYASTSTGAPYSWAAIASGIIPPTIADAGTAISVTTGSAKVSAG